MRAGSAPFLIICYFYTIILMYHRFKPQVANAQAGATMYRHLSHFVKVTMFLIVASLFLLIYTKGGISMGNFSKQFISVTVSYMTSAIAGVRPVT